MNHGLRGQIENHKTTNSPLAVIIKKEKDYSPAPNLFVKIAIRG